MMTMKALLLLRMQSSAQLAQGFAGAILTALGVRVLEPLFIYGVEPHYPSILAGSFAVTYVVMWIVHGRRGKDVTTV